ncbi:MAG: TolC family protein [Armatimonas sp.]
MLVPTTSVYQNAPAPALSLEAAVQEALKQHRRLAAGRKDATAARLGVRSAQALTNPDFYFSPALDQFNGTTEEMLITQPLELNGTRAARTGVARAQLGIAEAMLATETREVVAAVKTAYIGLWRERELATLAASVTQNASTLHQLTQKQVELGSRAGIDTAQTGLEVIRARQNETLARARVKQAETALNVAIGRGAEAPLPNVELPIMKMEVPAPEIAVKAALETRAELAGESSRQEGLRQEARLYRAEGRPDIAPQFRSQYVTFQRPKRSDYGFSLAIRLPFVDWGGRKGRIAQAEAAAQAQDDRIAQARREIEKEVRQALTRLAGATEIVGGYAHALPEAERLLRATRIGLEEGKMSVLAVLEAQRSYRATLTEYTEARADLALAQAELTRVMGGAK